MTAVTILYVLCMDTKAHNDLMMRSMTGRNGSVIQGVQEKYNVKIEPCHAHNVFYITGDRHNVLRAHESLARAFSRRRQWVASKC